MPVAYAELTARYWLTTENDAAAGLDGWIDYAQLGAEKVRVSYVRLAAPRAGAYAYVEYAFDPAAGTLPAGANSGVITSRLSTAGHADLSEANDYSYRPAPVLALNEHVALYRNGRLVYGTEPAAPAARSGASPAAGALTVTVLGNPVTGEQAEVEIGGAQGQAVALLLLDFQGNALLTQPLDQAAESQHQRVALPAGRSGVYLLKVITADQTRVVRIFKQ